MPEAEDEFADDVVAGAVGMIPLVGSAIAPFAKRISGKVRAEWQRNHSKAFLITAGLSNGA